MAGRLPTSPNLVKTRRPSVDKAHQAPLRWPYSHRFTIRNEKGRAMSAMTRLRHGQEVFFHRSRPDRPPNNPTASSRDIAAKLAKVIWLGAFASTSNNRALGIGEPRRESPADCRWELRRDRKSGSSRSQRPTPSVEPRLKRPRPPGQAEVSDRTPAHCTSESARFSCRNSDS